MSNHAHWSCVIAFASLTGLLVAPAPATEIEVANGTVLDQTALELGTVAGQNFILGPSTKFNIWNGGIARDIGRGWYGEHGPSYFDLVESALVVDDGGVLESAAITNATIELKEGGQILDYSYFQNTNLYLKGGSLGDWFDAGPGCNIEISGGIHGGYDSTLYGGSTMTITGGHLRGITLVDLATGSMTGGSAYGVRVANQSTFTATGGYIGGLEASSYDGYSSHAIVDGATVQFTNSWGSGSVRLLSGTVGTAHGGILIEGGTVTGDVFGGCVISGGTIQGNIELEGGDSGDSLIIKGGSIEGSIVAGRRDYGYVWMSIYVLSATLDGDPLDYRAGDSISLQHTDGALLEAILADGSYFDFRLNNQYIPGEDLWRSVWDPFIVFVPAPGALWITVIATVSIMRRQR